MQENNTNLFEEEVYDSQSGKGFKRIFKNFSFLTLGKIGGDLFNLILFVILSRKFGQEGIGQYSFAIGLTGIFSTLADFGLYDFTIKEISRNRNSFEDDFKRVFSLRSFQSFGLLVILFAIISVLKFSTETKIILAIVGTYQISYTLIDGVAAIFIAHEQMHTAGIITVSSKILTSLSAIIMILFHSSLVVVLLSLPVVSILQIYFLIIIIKKKFGEAKITFVPSLLMNTLKQVSPYGATEFLFQVYSRVDIVLIGFILGEVAAGLYNVGYRVVFFLLFIPSFSAVAIFPIVSRLFHSSFIEFKKMYNKSLNMMIIIGFPVSAGLWLISPQLIKLIFGPSFSQSAIILRIFSGLFLLVCLNTIMSIFLMSSDNQKETAKAQFITTIFSFISNFILIYFYGIEGAAIATMLSSVLVVIIYVFKLKKVVGLPNIKYKVLVAALGASAFCIPFSFTPSLSIFIVVPASIIIYLGIILLFKGIRENEVRMMLDLFGRGKSVVKFTP